MKTLSAVILFVLSASQSFAGGGSCDDCYDAYRCTDATGKITVRVEASHGREFTGAIGEMMVYPNGKRNPGAEFNLMSDGKGSLTANQFILKFGFSPRDGRMARFDSFQMFFSPTKWNRVPKARASVSKMSIETPMVCEGSGFYKESQIKPER